MFANSSARQRRFALIGTTMLIMLSGCGQKGPLYLPEKMPEKTPEKNLQATPQEQAQEPQKQPLEQRAGRSPEKPPTVESNTES